LTRELSTGEESTVYEISVEQHFDAAHSLRGYRGKCEAVHGHRFRVVVTLGFEGLNDIGLAYDFAEAKKHLKEVVARFDHVSLDAIPPFDSINPSSENIACTVFEELKARLGEDASALRSVEVWESPETRVTYRP
jgi:6-pyruvoyltetrahydropterin/6-carboxytetrahydropterin synthase